MANSPTIVSASLSDEEMRKSVKNLVDYVNSSMNGLAKSFDDNIEKMNASLKKLGTPSAGGSANTSATKQDTQAVEENTAARKKNTQAAKEQKVTLDQIAQAQKDAVAPKSARESFYAFVQGYKQQAQELSQYIKSFETGLNQAISSRLNELNSQLSTSKLKAKELNEEINRQYASGNKQGVAQIQEQLDRELRTHNQIENAIKNVNKEFAFEISYLASLYGELNNIHNKWHDVSTTNKSVAESQKQQTEELRKQSAIVGEIKSKQDANKAFERISLMPTDNIEQAKEKLTALEELKKRVANTPLFSAAKNNQLNQTVEQVRYQIEGFEKRAGKSSSALDAMNEHIKKNIQLQEQQKQATIDAGIAAQKSYGRILTLLKEQAEVSGGKTAIGKDVENNINYISQLENSIKLMRRAYYDMDDTQRESPIGKALLKDIENAQKLRVEVDKFNRQVYGMQRPSDGKTDVDKNIGSYERLSNLLKDLTSQYRMLGREERNAETGADLAGKIQRTSREIQKIQQQMNRPINLDAALAGSEKTLDDIAYKMQRLRSYRQGIDLTKEGAAKEIEEVDRKLQQLQKDADKWMSKSKSMIEQNNALGRSWNYMKNRLAFYFTVGASTSFVKNLIEIRSQYEMNERALGILIDSAERGTRIFNELSQMALVSPYTLIELSTAAKQLTAYDIAAKDVVDTTRRLADMASAVGIPIERLTYALGQIKAYGYLNARDARMFSNAGIPLVKQLADYYTELEGKMVSTADVYDRIKKKAIDMSDVMQVINKMTDEGGKFFDFQAKMAGTLKVQLANLTLAWNNMLNDIGASEQGIISSGIKMLKELFLRWKDINKAIENIAIALGVAKAAHLVYYGVVIGTNKAIAIETVLGTKLSNVLRNLGATMNTVLTSAATWWTLLGVAAGAAVIEVLRGNEAMKEFNKALRENAENTYNDLKKFSEQYSIIRKDLYKTENGKQTPVDIDEKEAKKAWEALREQIELSSHASDEYVGRLLSIENVSERLRQGFAVIDSIQSVSAAIKELGDDTIKLEKDWSAWWNLGLLPDGTIGNLKDTHMWLSKIEEKYGSIVNARKVASTSKTSEGFDNVFQEEAGQFVENYEEELERFRKDLQITKQSVIDFIELKGWNGDVNKINEAFKTFTDNLVLKNQLNPQQAYTLQLEMEEARSQAAKQALLTRINDEKAALKETRDAEQRAALIASINENVNEYNTWSDFNGRKKVEWERFTKWLKEQHISETTAMFRNMDAEDIKSLNFQEGQHADWVNRMVTQYAKEHKMSYDDAFNYLKSWVTSANQWSVFIPLVISTEDKKTVYQQLGEYDKIIDEADAQIERLTKRINELKKKKEKDKEETEELTKAEKELAKAQEDKAEAEEKGGHGKKEKKDAKAAAKAQKQAESELQKALKEELQLIDKVRGAYKNLTKEGVSSLDAISLSTSGFEKSVSNINKVLGKYGIGQIDLKKFAGIENPHKLVEMLELQLNKLLKSGVAKPSEIQDLEVKIRDLKLDAKSFDSKTIVEGLNNELGKLKDEYELAVELDANPELGDMFLDMFGIDKSALSSSIDDYMFAVQDEFRKKSQELGYSGWGIDVFKANEDTWKDWGKNAGLSDEALDKFKAKFVEAQNVVKKTVQDTVKQTKDLEYKLSDTQGKIAIETTRLKKLQADREIADVKSKDMSLTAEQRAFFANQKSLLDLQIKDQENTIARLGDEVLQMLPTYKNLFNSIVEHSEVATRKIAKQWKEALSKAVKNANGTYTITDPNDPTKTATITKKQYGTEVGKVDKELQKSTPVFQKIKEAFKKGEDGTTDWAKGIELLGGELDKLAGIVSSIGNFAEQLGFSRETVEIINDVATSMSGVATMSQGVGQIASGDYIGGAASMLSGLMTTVSTWLDNSDNKILDQIKESERAVKSLENTYRNLSHTAENAYGAMTSGAKKAMQANKELQLIELQRQLTLERSRSSKKRDEDKIVELEGQIVDLKNEIHDASQDIINDLLGISSAGDGITTLVSAMVEAFRNGEDAMEAFGKSWDEMIDNMILKLIVSQYMSKAWEELMAKMQKKQDEMLKTSSDAQASAQKEVDRLSEMTDNQLAMWMFENNMLSGLGAHADSYDDFKAWFLSGGGWAVVKPQLDAYRKAAEAALTAATETLEGESFEYTKWSLDYMNTEGRDYMNKYAEALKNALGEWYKYGENAEGNLSALQQGIQSVSETTASALEAYMNGVSQQVYLQSEYLRQIAEVMTRDDNPNDDIKIASLSQILLQLRSSYETQQAIHSLLDGWNNANGQAVRVELVS